MNKKSLILLSGGIDSTTVLHRLWANPTIDMAECVAMIFDYGQTLQKEIAVAEANARRYGATPLTIKIDLAWLGSACAILQSDGPQILPLGRTRDEIAADGTPLSYVPYRNGIFIAYAVAYGEVHDIPRIYLGANGLDSGNYWDDRQEFVAASEVAAREGTHPEYLPYIRAPFSTTPKAAIVAWGIANGVDYSNTWSCYRDRNDSAPCGYCDSCVQREEALRAGGWYNTQKPAPYSTGRLVEGWRN